MKKAYYIFSELSQLAFYSMLIFVALEMIKPRLVLAHLNLLYCFIFWLITAIISLVLNNQLKISESLSKSKGAK